VAHLDQRVQSLLVAFKVLAVLAKAALLLGAAHVPRPQRLEETKADVDSRVLGKEERVE